MRIVQTANFVTPQSGGIRTALAALGSGYTAAGHERVLVLPGEHDSDVETPDGRVVTVRAPRLARSGGYRVIVDRERLKRLLAGLRPDRLEVSDRSTLACLGAWARQRDVGAVAFSHERLDALLALRLGPWLPPRPARRAADRWNRHLAAAFTRIVCTTAYAAEEFRRIGAGNVSRVPLGVDLARFTPAAAAPALRERLAPDGRVLLVSAGRLSPEKRPELAVETVRQLARRGVRATLVVAGDGPLRPALERSAAGLDVVFAGHVGDRAALARLYATADVALALGPVETFGLAALEALACGTPIVTSRTGAVGELLAPGAGVAAFSHPAAVAAGVRAVLDWPPADRRAAARRRAEQFPWSATVERMLALHAATPVAA